MSDVKTGNLWDIFCRVIDNYGDVGVCWRLATGLAERGERVRLWVDDASALAWMAPEGAQGVEVQPWTALIPTNGRVIGDILVEAFGCDIAPEFVAAYAYMTRASGQPSMWINLEYLSAEGFSERNHGLASPVTTGPGAGLDKHFFYPGFTAATGGLLREPNLLARQARFDRAAWLRKLGIKLGGERLISLFCYEPAMLGDFLEQLAGDTPVTRLLVSPGRAAAAVQAVIASKNRLQPSWNMRELLSFSFLPALTQLDFDHLLWACDLNFVRGEDSLVRALWAGKPFVWQIYPQHDDAHYNKLSAFLELLEAPASLRNFHLAWNDLKGQNEAKPRPLPPLALPEWQQTIATARRQQLQRVDLVTQLMGFALKNL